MSQCQESVLSRSRPNSLDTVTQETKAYYILVKEVTSILLRRILLEYYKKNVFITIDALKTQSTLYRLSSNDSASPHIHVVLAVYTLLTEIYLLTK